MTDVVALIVAAGRGSRFAADSPTEAAPKQYRTIGGISLLRRAILAFQQHPQVNGVRVVIHPDDQALYDQATAGLSLLSPVHGGATRQELCAAAWKA